MEPLEREVPLLLLDVVEEDEPLEREDSLPLPLGLERAMAALLLESEACSQYETIHSPTQKGGPDRRREERMAAMSCDARPVAKLRPPAALQRTYTLGEGSAALKHPATSDDKHAFLWARFWGPHHCSMILASTRMDDVVPNRVFGRGC